MEKRVRCEHCYQTIITEMKCDTCGEDLLLTKCGVPITLQGGYGSSIDESEYHFCDWKCLMKFVLKVMKNEQPRNIIQGDNDEQE